MKILREIAGRIWALWGLVSFMATFLIIFLPSMLAYLVPDPAGTAYFIKLARVWMRVWFFLTGCRIRVQGSHHFEKGKSYVVTCNHNSLLDPPLSCPFIPGPNKTIAKISFARVPIFGWYYARGSVLVDRSSEKSRRKSLADMRAVLQKGMHMCIYPEGTRNRTSEPLKPFYSGAFKLACETGHDVIPAVILNTKKAVPLHKTFFFLPKKLAIHFLPPVSATNSTAEELKDKVFAVMKQYIIQHQGPV